MLANVVRDPSLLTSVRTIVESCRVNSSDSGRRLQLDFAKLCSQPLLQSIYAETLRVRVASYVFRGPDRKDLHLKNWRIPKDAVMMISSYHAQMDREAWSTGHEEHPVEEFWAHRFLKYPKEESTDEAQANPSEPEFSLEGRSTSWIPYGGGQRMCPGRHFNKHVMISSLAIIVALFDIELLPPNSTNAKASSRPGKPLDKDGSIPLPQSDVQGFGFGTMSPKGETPFRIRRRLEVENAA